MHQSMLLNFHKAVIQSLKLKLCRCQHRARDIRDHIQNKKIPVSSSYYQYTDRMLCAISYDKTKRQDACKGDSGGAMTVKVWHKFLMQIFY